MSEEIKSVLGFEVDQALEALAKLDAAMQSVGQHIGSMATVFNTFNTAQQSLLNSLKATETQARATAAALRNASQGGQNYSPTTAPNAGGLTGQAAANAMNQLMGQTAPAVQNVNNQLSQQKQNLAQLTVSWETLGRIVTTQFIVRAISAVRDAFGDSFDAALKFQKQISEIKAISMDTNRSEIAGSVRSLSDQFHMDLSTVAEAKYETISNQFTTTAQQADILSNSMQLAKVSASGVDQAVNLLTGTINAYGFSSARAADLAQQFDKVIELGRVRANELATAMGRVAPIAHEMGVSIEEVNAAFVSLTIGGVKASEAATQIRGVMSGLLKPSKDMKAAFKELGYESGTAMIQALGFMGTLQALKGVTNGTSGEMAELLRNIRALAGGLRLTGEGLEQYQRALKTLQSAELGDKFKVKFDEFMGTDAEKVTEMQNKFKNFFSVDFGNSLLSYASAFAGMGRSTDIAIAGLKGLTSVLPGVVIGLTLCGAAYFRIQMQAAAANAQIANTGTAAGRASVNMALLGKITGIAGAALGAIALGRAIGTYINDSIQRQYIEQSKFADFQKAKSQEIAELKIKTEEIASREIIKGLAQHIAEYNKLYFKKRDAIVETAKIEESVAKSALNRITSHVQSTISEILAMSRKAEDNITKSFNRQQNNRDKTNDAIFNIRNEQRPQDEQFRMIGTRATQLQEEASKKLSTARTEREREAADAAQARADAYSQQYVTMAKQLGTTESQARAEQLLNRLANSRSDAETKYQQVQGGMARAADQKAQGIEKISAAIEEQKRIYEENNKVADESGNLFSDKEIKEREAKALTAAQRIKELLGDMGKKLGTDTSPDQKVWERYAHEVQQILNSVDMQVVVDGPKTMAKIASDLQAEADKVKVEIPIIGKIEKLTEMDFQKDGSERMLAELQKRYDTLYAKTITGAEVEKQSTVTQKDAQRDILALAALNRQTGSFAVGGTGIADNKAFDGWIMGMAELSKKAKITKQDIDDLNEKFKMTDPSRVWASRWQQAKAQPLTENILKEMNAKAEADAKKNPDQAKDAAKLREYGNLLENIKAKWPQIKAAEDGANESINLGKQGVSATNGALSSSRQRVIDFALAYNDVLTQIGRVAMAQANLQSPGAANLAPSIQATGDEKMASLGGYMGYFSSGGFARGTDRIPAMLTAGETVINPRSSRKFFSELQAMNAGIRPVFRSQGGATNNLTIGDINVNGGKTPQATGRAVLSEIRREFRRGSGRI